MPQAKVDLSLNHAMSKIFHSVIGMLMVLALIACNQSTTLDPDPEKIDGEVSIAYLKALAVRSATSVTETRIIRGTITANDRYGELQQRLMIEDESGAISIVLRREQLHTTYPVGGTLSVHCTGLILCNYGGKVELGSDLEAGYTVGLDAVAEQRRLTLERTTSVWPEPTPLQITNLAPQWIDRYVRLDKVRFVDRGHWCNSDPETHQFLTTEHTIIDAAGNPLLVRTLGSVLYANEPLPEGSGSLYGVIDYFGGHYSLRVVNRGFYF